MHESESNSAIGHVFAAPFEEVSTIQAFEDTCELFPRISVFFSSFDIVIVSVSDV